MSGNVVIITGGTEGIGAACVRRLLNSGYRITYCGLSQVETLPTGDVLALYGDIRDSCFRKRIVDETLQRFGRIDGLINNAGIGLYAPASETSSRLAQDVFEVNVLAPLHLVELARPHLRAAANPFIVNVGSVGGWVTLPWASIYCASKHALHSVTEGLYRELKQEGIHVMLVVPGIVRTNFRENVLAGTAPPRVAEISYVISPQQLAQAIERGIRQKKRSVVLPKVAWLFALLNYSCPWLMDRYCEYKWGRQTKGMPPAPAPNRLGRLLNSWRRTGDESA